MMLGSRDAIFGVARTEDGSEPTRPSCDGEREEANAPPRAAARWFCARIRHDPSRPGRARIWRWVKPDRVDARALGPLQVARKIRRVGAHRLWRRRTFDAKVLEVAVDQLGRLRAARQPSDDLRPEEVGAARRSRLAHLALRPLRIRGIALALAAHGCGQWRHQAEVHVHRLVVAGIRVGGVGEQRPERGARRKHGRRRADDVGVGVQRRDQTRSSRLAVALGPGDLPSQPDSRVANEPRGCDRAREARRRRYCDA